MILNCADNSSLYFNVDNARKNCLGMNADICSFLIIYSTFIRIPSIVSAYL